MITFGRESWEDKDIDDVIELCGTWWNDSLFFKKYGIEYDVDKNLFLNLHKHGALIYVCGRNEEDKLISCYVGIKQAYMFNKNVLSAHEIVWCVHKDFRSFKNLLALMNAIETLMKEENIVVWNLHVSNEQQFDTTGTFLEKKGYTFMDKIFSKKGVNNG